MFELVLRKLFNVRVIPHPEGGPYLERFFITPLSWSLRVFVHKIHTPDPDRLTHDHPWDFWTFPLSKYVEKVTGPGVHFGHVAPRRFHFRAAEHTHRIVRLDHIPTWTIVVTKRARREWGFRCNGRWVHWRDYLNMPDAPDSTEDVVG